MSSSRARARPDSSGVLIATLRRGLRGHLLRGATLRRRSALRRRSTLRRSALRRLRRRAGRHLLRLCGPAARVRRPAVQRLRRALGLRRVLALLDHEVLRAVRLLLVAVLEVLDEVVQGLLLVLRLQQVPDRLLDLGERLLLGRRHLRDLEDVVAELRLDGPLDLALRCGEDRRVEALLLLALRHVGQLAALCLGSVVGRVLLGHLLPRLTRLERLERGGGLRLLRVQDHEKVARLGLREALLVLVVVVRDLGVGDLALVLDDRLLKLVRQDREAHAVEQVGLALAGARQELLVVGLLRERLLLLLLEGGLDLLVGGRDVALLALLEQPLRGDQELHRLVAQPGVLLLALSLEVRGLRLGGALRDRLLRLGGGALREVRRVRGDDVLRLLAGRLRLLLRGGGEPVVELLLGDRRVADLGDRVRRNGI